MMRTLVLGAGFGGLTVATELRRLLGDQCEVVLVDRREHFLMGLRKLWALVGIGTLADGMRSRERLSEASDLSKFPRGRRNSRSRSVHRTIGQARSDLKATRLPS